MAGTGELNVLKRLRVMHGQIKEGMSYGTHMALHMALGLLFLGKGRFTLGTSKVAISALLCSFYPVFPPHPSSNRFHLQALRHMWVLAVEPRCLIAKDVESGKSVYLRLKFKLREQLDDKARDTLTSKYLTAPTLTPSMSSIVSIQTDSPRYWPVTLAFDKVKDHMRSFIRNQTIFVKRKTGHLSYAQDPRGLRSLYIQPETEGAAVVFDAGLNAKLTIDKKDALLNLLAAFQSFSSIARTDLMYFCCAENDDLSTTQLATAFMLSAVMESLVQDKPEALGLYRAFSQSFERHGAIVVRDVQSLVFTHKLCAHESYSQILQNRKQSLVRREYVESVYIETEKMVNRLLRDQSMHKSLALYLEMPSREGAIRKNDLLVSQLILPFLRSPTLGVLQDIRDKVTRLVSQGSVGRDVLHTLLPVVLARVMQQNAEGSAELRIDRQLVVTLASALLV